MSRMEILRNGDVSKYICFDMKTTTATRPGRQRSEAADQAILDATLAVLAEQGYAALRIATVIERSGVSSATLYRRYATKVELVTAAVATLLPVPDEIDTGSFETDLGALIRRVAPSIERRNQRAVQALRGGKGTGSQLHPEPMEDFLKPPRPDT